MKVIALTGGVATGKSTAVSLMRSLDPSVVLFDCDKSVSTLLKRAEVLSELVDVFGDEVILDNRSVNRAFLRRLIFANPEKRVLLERLLHPKVREECLEMLEISRKDPSSSLFVAEVPLLFESGFNFGQEKSLVVATSEKTQRVRLRARNGFNDDLITSILAAQISILEKVAKAEVVFWNEGPVAQLEGQISRFLKQV